jgi:hypothetical protein
VIRFYNNLQGGGDRQNTCTPYKTSQFVGWVVGWKFAFACNQDEQPLSRSWTFLVWVDNFRVSARAQERARLHDEGYALITAQLPQRRPMRG